MPTVHDRINVDADIMHGKPVIAGTRIPVYVILDLMASGFVVKDVLKEYPDLTAEDVQACLSYAARLADHEVGVL